jgi:lysophospholipase L1-like esterase
MSGMTAASPVPPPRPRPRWRLRLAAALGATLLALVLSEVLLRFVSPGYAERDVEYTVFVPPGDARTWVYTPNSVARFAWDGDPIGVLPPGARSEVAINAEGLRGPLPLPGRPTVVVLGDSFVFGEGVELQDTFVARLESSIGGSHAFVNAGVAGQGTPDEAARVPYLLERFAPRALLLVHIPNDAIPTDQSAARGVDLIRVPERSGLRLLALLQARGGDAELEAWYRSYYEGGRERYWEICRGALASVAERCRQRDVRLGVAEFPLLHRLDDYPFEVSAKRVRDACADLGAPFIDLRPALATHDAGELWVHPTDRHPNRLAHEIAAEALAPLVRELLR